MDDTHNMDDEVPQTFTNLDTFSQQLKRQTKENRLLQEDLENATRRTMERIGHVFLTHSTINTAGQLSYTPISITDRSSDIGCDVPHSWPQSVIQPPSYGPDGLDPEVAPNSGPFPGKEVSESAVLDYSQQTHEQQEQQSSAFQQFSIDLHTKLREVQMERDGVADQRREECWKHADQIASLQGTIVEQQATHPRGDLTLSEAEDEAEDFSTKSKPTDRPVGKVYSTLMVYGKRFGVGEDEAGKGQDSLAVEKVLQRFEQENHDLRERLVRAEEQLSSQEERSKATEELDGQRDRMEQIIASLDQKVAILTEKLSSSLSSASSLRVQLNLLQKQAESQAMIHKNQVTDLESALTVLRSDQQDSQKLHAEKVGCLEKLVAQSQSEAEEARRGRERSLLEAREQEMKLHTLMLELERAQQDLSQEKERSGQLSERDRAHAETVASLQRELGQRSLGTQELQALVGALRQDCLVQTEAQLRGEKLQQQLQQELGALRAELDTARQQLRCGQAQALTLQGLAGPREAELHQRQALLEEELQLRRQEAWQAGARLGEARGRCLDLEAETEALRRELEDRGKVAELLESAAQRGSSMEALHEERDRLNQQLSEDKLEINQLKAELDQREARLCVLEQQSRRQRKGLSQQSRRVTELTQTNQQLTATLEAQSSQLLRLTEEQEELKRRLARTVEEHEGVAAKLRSQLQSTRAELDGARASLRVLEGADSHGMKVAMGMQEQITAKREHVDALRGRIQILEETLERLTQEKNHQSVDSRRQRRHLASARQEKRQLQGEVESLRGLENQLRQKVDELEAALHKMSESFAECQDHLHTQEQDFMRLKLQHALDLKELKDQTRRSPGRGSQWDSLSSRAGVAAPPSAAPQRSKDPPERGPSKLQENPTQDVRSLVKELQDVNPENHRAHSAPRPCSCLRRRRSAPERVLTGATPSEVTKETKETIELYPPKSCDVDELKERNARRSSSRKSHKVCYAPSLPSATPSPQAALPGRMSPVHSLLTSEPKSTPRSENSPAVGPLKGSQGNLENLQMKVEDLRKHNQEIKAMGQGSSMRAKAKERQQQIALNQCLLLGLN